MTVPTVPVLSISTGTSCRAEADGSLTASGENTYFLTAPSGPSRPISLWKKTRYRAYALIMSSNLLHLIRTHSLNPKVFGSSQFSVVTFSGNRLRSPVSR
jgi:hypothetical protein